MEAPAQTPQMPAGEMPMPQYPYSFMGYEQPYYPEFYQQPVQKEAEVELIPCQCQCEKCKCEDVKEQLLDEFSLKLEQAKKENFEEQKAAWQEYGRKMGFI